MFCTNCGKEIPDSSKICNNCGFTLKVPVQNQVCCTQDGQVRSSQGISTKEKSSSNKESNAKPLSTATFFFLQVLFSIPVVNLVFILYWSIKKDINENLKSYARSMLIWAVIFFVILVFAFLTFIFMRYPHHLF